MGKEPGKINKMLNSGGNGSLAIGTLFALGSVACPCPVCIGSSILFLLNGLRKKIGVRLWK